MATSAQDERLRALDGKWIFVGNTRFRTTDDVGECYLEFAPDERCQAYRFSLAYDNACEIRLHDVALYAPKAGPDG